jgi:hypothetical protein
MYALMHTHIYQATRQPHGFDSRVYNLLARRYEGDYRTVVIGIEMGIEYTRGVDRMNCLNQLVDNFRLATLTEVWYTLDERHNRCQMSDVRCQNE